MKDNSKWKLTQQTASNLIVVLVGLTFYLVASHFGTVRAQLSSWMGIIAPFLWGIALAYLLDGPARFFQNRLHLRRGLAVLLSCLLAGLLIAFLVGMVVPQLVDSVLILINNVPVYLARLDKLVAQSPIEVEGLESLLGSYSELVEKATEMLSAVLPKLLGYGMAIGSGVVSMITAVISSIYMLLGKEKLLHQLRKVTIALLPQNRAARLMEICRHANGVFSGFIYGKIIDSAIMGLICFVVTSIFKMPFALLISVIVGVTNVIPFFGPFIGAIPSIMILLIVEPISALEFGIFVIILQQFDGNILGPKILGDSTGLPALWVLVAIIVGGGLFGFVGMLVGVPTFAVLYSLGSDVLAARLRAKGFDGQGRPLPAAGPAGAGETAAAPPQAPAAAAAPPAQQEPEEESGN